ncbi:MAG: ImmA/IrrE family metallo-endopeptidase [Actinomycetota bacterium]
MAIQQEATRAADSLLDALWPGGRDDPGLPIDPVQIAKRLGIDVYETELEPDVAAVLVKEPGQDPTIALNADDSPNRKRFSCAHEVGHFMRRSDSLQGVDEYAYLDKRDAFSGQGRNPEEIYANNFAASLLMPEELVKFFHRHGSRPSEMALRFDVSQEAMEHRINNLGLR